LSANQVVGKSWRKLYLIKRANNTDRAGEHHVWIKFIADSCSNFSYRQSTAKYHQYNDVKRQRFARSPKTSDLLRTVFEDQEIVLVSGDKLSFLSKTVIGKPRANESCNCS